MDDFANVAARAALVNPTSPRLRTFCEIVGILAALHQEDGAGLLGINWKRIQQASQHLLRPGMTIAAHLAWVETLARWAVVIEREATPAGGARPQLDALTVRAAEPDIQELLLFSMSNYLTRMRQLAAPAAEVRAIANLPESILQALAAAHFGIDFRHAPATLPQLDYDRFFSGQLEFRLPAPGSKMELTSLLVIVPALMSDVMPPDRKPRVLCEPALVRPLQQKLVDRLRNPNAHTYADFSDKEAKFLVDLCAEWLEAMAALAGYESTSALPIVRNTPTLESLTALLYGGEEP